MAVVVTCIAGAIFALPASAEAASPYVTFVSCSVEAEVPSHACQYGDSPGIFFESPNAEVGLEVCVLFPDAVEECSEEELAEEGVLYVFELPPALSGTHVVTWYVEGVEAATWSYTVSEPPPPPPPPTTTTTAPTPQPAPAPAPAPAPIVTSPQPSPACLAAESQVKKLQKKLGKAKSPKAKTALHKALRRARAAARGAC